MTIGHVLQDDTEEAVLISKDAQQVVSIPTQFRRINGKPKSLNKEMDDQLREVGCVSIPPGTPIRCEIPELDCGCLYDYLGARRPRYYNDPTIDRRYFGMLETDHIQSVAKNHLTGAIKWDSPQVSYRDSVTTFQIHQKNHSTSDSPCTTP